MLSDTQLLEVRRPAQYIGKEWNVSRKDFDKAEVTFALCFPDLYDVGMSNLGLRILYGLINAREGVVCERAFSPAPDMEALLRKEGQPLFSLESQRPLRDFDFVGFSLSYELGYTNVLNMLDLAGIPLRATQRGNDVPLIIGGGPAVLNPEPMAPFFDLFVLGEAEEAVIEIIELYRKHKGRAASRPIDKQELLFQLAQIPGVYVPSFYEAYYSEEGNLKEFRPLKDGIPARIQKRFIRDFDNAYFPTDWLVPYIAIVHDRLTMEIMRGCPNQCRFCQARTQYYPLRTRQPERVLRLTEEAYRKTGYEEISLIGLSVSDYPKLDQLVGPLVRRFKEQGVSISFPSIKPKVMLGALADLIATIKKTGLTFAPEAANARLRAVLGKDFDEGDFFATLQQAYRAGYQHVKLYFMIGLPTENEQDLDGIIDFSKRVSEARRPIAGRPAQVNVSVNTLIPKPHTAFQWFGMMDMDGMRQKQEYVLAKNRNRNIRLSFHNRSMSYLEGVFSRGDRRLSAVVERAFRQGCRLDAWDEYFDFQKWLEAFRESNIDPAAYLGERKTEEILPWDFLDVGVSKELLVAEYKAVCQHTGV